jgi:hypothetical protein
MKNWRFFSVNNFCMPFWSTILVVVIRVPVAVFRKNSPIMTYLSSFWRLNMLDSSVNLMRDGLHLPGLSFVPGDLVKFLSLPVCTFSIAKSLSGAMKLFVVIGRVFDKLEVAYFFFFFVQHSSPEILSLFQRLLCSACEVSSCPDSLLVG